MKIGIDIRFLDSSAYSQFVLELVTQLIHTPNEHYFIIYSNKFLDNLNTVSSQVKKVNIETGSFQEQTDFLKILRQDNNAVMLFWNNYKPLLYKKEYILFIGNLRNIYYENFQNAREKFIYTYLCKQNYKHAQTILCFDQNSRQEIIEHYDIPEKKIHMIPGFFPEKERYNNLSEIENFQISLDTKYGIDKHYFIYSGGSGIEKNYEKLILSIARLRKEGFNIGLVILGNTIAQDIELRNLILSHQLQDSIFFVAPQNLQEEAYIYKTSLGVIFPSLYEPFPFHLAQAVFTDTTIFASNLKNIENIFKENIQYFSPISVNSMYEVLVEYLRENKAFPHTYTNILSQLSRKHSAETLLTIID